MIQRLIPMGIILFAVAFMIVNPLRENQFAPASDEGFYYAYASQVEQKGPAAFPELINWYANDGTAKLHPSPIRVGYIGVLALLFKIFGPSFFVIGVFSLVCFLAFLVLNFYFLKKTFGPERGGLVLLLLATSPLLMGISRRAMPDMPLCLLWAASFWAFFELLQARTWRRLLFFVTTLATGFLFKESTIFLFFVFMMMAFCIDYAEGWKNGLTRYMFSAVGLAGVIAGVVIIVLLGGPQQFLLAVNAIIATHTTVNAVGNVYALNLCSGPWHRFLIDFLLISPVVVVMAIVRAGQLTASKISDSDRFEWLALLFFVLVYFFYNLLPHTKSVRYLAVGEIVLAILAFRGIEEIFKAGFLERIRIRPYVVVSLIAVLNFSVFYKVFYVPSLLDPVTKHIAGLLGFFFL